MNDAENNSPCDGGGVPDWPHQRTRPRILLLGNGQRPNVLAESERLVPVIERFADVVLSDFAFREQLATVEADFAIVLGGDGSILHAVNQMGLEQIPILGVNMGKLGFLASLAPNDLGDVLPDVCAGRCQIVEHLMLRCTVLRTSGPDIEALGLNEMAVLGGPPFTILDIDLYVDSILATTYSCDGLIISTPVGSTAHSLSTGGPILRKCMQAFVISPISPHTLTVRPIVDRASRTYEVIVQQTHETTSVVVDGRVVCKLSASDRVRVERAKPVFKAIEVRGQNYYKTLREKLGWGGHIH